MQNYNSKCKIIKYKKILKKIFHFSFFIFHFKFDRAKRENGFALTLILLIVSIVASISLSVFEIFFTELNLTRNINESQYAFYAADTGAECVLYWDLKQGPISVTAAKEITCNNETKTVGGAAQSSFQLLFNNGACANVTVNINALSGQRTIESLGRSKYDDSVNNCNASLPKRSERGLELKYF